MALVQSFKINGQNFNPFVNWEDAEVVASKDDSGTQLNITVNNVEFVNAAAKFIRDYIDGGITGTTKGFYEGPKFEMVVQDDLNTLTVFKGCLDFVEDYKEISPVRVRCALRRLQDKKTIQDRSRVITMLLLKEEGLITSNDYATIPYVVEKKFNAIEFIVLSITTFLMLKELAEAIRRLADDIAEIAAHAGGGLSGPVAAVVLAVIKAAINLAYSILLIIYIIDLVQDLIEYLISPVRDWKGLKFKTMLEKGSQYMGYNYNTSPALFENLFYLPSKTEPAPLSQVIQNAITGQGTIGIQDDGIPNSSDIGHTLDECFQLHADLTRSKVNVNENTNTINQEPLVNDSFWDQDAQFTLPNTLNESKVFNGDDLKGRKLIQFEKDDRDDWTVYDELGRIYEIVTHPVTVNDEKCVNIKGLEDIKMGVALGSRKDGLNEIENAVKKLAQIADSVVNFFGGNSNLAQKIQNRVGMLRVSQNATNVPKLLYLTEQNGALKMPANYKDFLSAKTMWEDYHVEDSWVETVNGVPNRGQKQLFNDSPILIPLGFQQMLSIIDKTRINDLNGNKANVTELVWKFSKDKAKINGWVRRRYTNNLQHTFYNSDDPNL